MITYLLILTRGDPEGCLNVNLEWTSTFGLHRPLVSDLDHSYLIKIGEFEVLKLVEAAIQDHFWEYDARRRDAPALWKRYYEKKKKRGSEACPRSFLAHDVAGRSIARQMVDFVYENRLVFGDDGDWHLWTCRDLALRRGGVSLADFKLDRPKKPVCVKALQNADYTDELDSFRFPSISCLRGASQPLSQLRGAERFRSLFIHDGAGVYIAFEEDSVLYIGMSQCFSQRLSSATAHHKLGPILKKHPLARVAVIYYPYWKLPAIDDVVTAEDEAAVWGRIRQLIFNFEQACIEHYRPRYNGAAPGEEVDPVR